MAANNLLDTSTVSLSDIIGNGKKYVVPLYQRDYSWKRDQWEDLWNDIVSVVKTDNVHYMGTIVLQDLGEKKFHIIDGQQRFTTLALIVLGVISQLNKLIELGVETEKNKERVSLLNAKFVGDKDPGSLTYSSKLSLNENNNSFFQTNLLVFRSPVSVKTLKDSDKLLWQAYGYFNERISEYFTNSQDGEQITNFLNKLVAEKLMFIQIVVQDELNAYTVFETLNSRGVGLTVTDLLKNYLFSVASEVDRPHIKIKWQSVVDVIGLDMFPVFMRHFWISSRKLIRQEALFKAIRDSISTSSDVINLLEYLEQNAVLYNALSNYADTFWEGNREIKKRIKELALFSEKQAYPILLSAYNNLDRNTFAGVLKMISVVTFRYTVIGKLHTNQKEEIYNKAALAISEGRVTNLNQIATLLKGLYPTDTEFNNSFATKLISTKRTKKLVRYILFSIENHMSNNDYDYEENPATIEHILLENDYQNYNRDFPTNIYDSWVYRLGNYTLLEDDKNRQCATQPFEGKKIIYQTSQYILTHRINSNSWTPSTIELRQEMLSDQATAIWRISQLDI
jgi:hypothetical protein